MKLRPLFAATLMLLTVCSDPVTEPSMDRRVLLSELADVVILPTYDEFLTATQALETSTSSLCGSLDLATLGDAQQRWRDARRPWRRAEGFQLGPVRDLRIKNAVEFLPLRVEDVEAVLADSTPLDAEYVGSLGVAARGLPVLEFLLFDPAGNDAALQSLSPRRCAYVEALAGDLVVQAQRLDEAWRSDGLDYRATLLEMQQGAIDDLVNRMIATLQLLEGERLAKPLGRRDGGEPQLQSIEVRRSAAALDDLKDGLVGIRALYTGDLGTGEGAGIASLIVSANPTLDQRIVGQLDASRASLDRIVGPLERAILEAPTVVEEAFVALRALLRLIAADLASQLGVTTTFSDNDGD